MIFDENMHIKIIICYPPILLTTREMEKDYRTSLLTTTNIEKLLEVLKVVLQFIIKLNPIYY